MDLSLATSSTRTPRKVRFLLIGMARRRPSGLSETPSAVRSGSRARGQPATHQRTTGVADHDDELAG